MNDELMKNLKFAKFLADKGLLSPIVNSYTEFRSQQNYPFELKDRRLFKIAILKALLTREDMIISTKNGKETIERIANDMVKSLYDEQTIDKSIIELMKQYKIPQEFEKTISYMIERLDKKSFTQWIKTASKNFQERKIAESDNPKEAKKAQNTKSNKEISEQIGFGDEIRVNPTAENLKKIVKKRVLRKKIKK